MQDLTKMADLIRARTYDAFVPIIAIAIIYYILSKILMKITDKIAEKLEPKNRKPEKILQKIFCLCYNVEKIFLELNKWQNLMKST